MAHYTGDAEPNYRPGGYLQGTAHRADPMYFSLHVAAPLWRTSSLSSRGQCVGIDPRLDLPCGRGGWHTGPTCETNHRQDHHRWGTGAAPGTVAHHSVRTDDGGHAPAQGRADPTSGGVLSWAAFVRSGWQFVFGHQ